MSFMAGQALAYLKLAVVAGAIMAVIWVIGMISVALHNRKDGPTDTDADTPD